MRKTLEESYDNETLLEKEWVGAQNFTEFLERLPIAKLHALCEVYERLTNAGFRWEAIETIGIEGIGDGSTRGFRFFLRPEENPWDPQSRLAREMSHAPFREFNDPPRWPTAFREVTREGAGHPALHIQFSQPSPETGHISGSVHVDPHSPVITDDPRGSYDAIAGMEHLVTDLADWGRKPTAFEVFDDYRARMLELKWTLGSHPRLQWAEQRINEVGQVLSKYATAGVEGIGLAHHDPTAMRTLESIRWTLFAIDEKGRDLGTYDGWPDVGSGAGAGASAAAGEPDRPDEVDVGSYAEARASADTPAEPVGDHREALEGESLDAPTFGLEPGD